MLANNFKVLLCWAQDHPSWSCVLFVQLKQEITRPSVERCIANDIAIDDDFKPRVRISLGKTEGRTAWRVSQICSELAFQAAIVSVLRA